MQGYFTWHQLADGLGLGLSNFIWNGEQLKDYIEVVNSIKKAQVSFSLMKIVLDLRIMKGQYSEWSGDEKYITKYKTLSHLLPLPDPWLCL